MLVCFYYLIVCVLVTNIEQSRKRNWCCYEEGKQNAKLKINAKEDVTSVKWATYK